MDIEKNVIEKLRQLPLEKQRELLDFAEFLSQQNVNKPNSQSIKDLSNELKVDTTKADIDQIRLDFMDSLANKYQASNSGTTKSPRIMGLFSGKGWISEDFNDPLPDDFWDS
ncbi:Protein of unknown function (DUF2281) [Xenococcus sp. PCC 7305]|uniref:DUF2281 domain-containing protein n=1 Tax=Xenococcus sp. PCC 7305 TaxID=102125 RepID=UPI0002ABE559|nr:DUF2281 domain-containing protein [Xenococcus sp. PCC 7305]ELS01803.1 Protein of unknown function (DUF2281) [Xenococcus sp. PCC 7305]